MTQNNSRAIKGLKKILPGPEYDDVRHELIYNAVLLGSYQARKEYRLNTGKNPSDFEIGRITTRIYEAQRISERIEGLARNLQKSGEAKEENAQKLMVYLQEQISGIKRESIIREGIFENLEKLSEIKKKVGKRLEGRLCGGKSVNEDGKEKSKVFLDEAFTISTVLTEEVDYIEDRKSNIY